MEELYSYSLGKTTLYKALKRSGQNTLCNTKKKTPDLSIRGKVSGFLGGTYPQTKTCKLLFEYFTLGTLLVVLLDFNKSNI